jgi:hypothetical protein
MFRTVRPSIVRSLFIVDSAMVYVIQVCRQLSSRTKFVCPSSGIYSLKPLLSVQWINCWWWADELSETCRVSWQHKFVKLVHLVGFITKKFVTMRHGHMNVKKASIFPWRWKQCVPLIHFVPNYYTNCEVLSRRQCTSTANSNLFFVFIPELLVRVSKFHGIMLLSSFIL